MNIYVYIYIFKYTNHILFFLMYVSVYLYLQTSPQLQGLATGAAQPWRLRSGRLGETLQKPWENAGLMGFHGIFMGLFWI